MAVQSTLIHSLPLSTMDLRTLLSRLTKLYLAHQTVISRSIYLTLFLAIINRIRNAISEQKSAAREQSARTAALNDPTSSAGPKKPPKAELNAEFFRNLWRLLRIVVPGARSKEARLLVTHTVFLVVRTLISLYVAELDGRIVSALVRGKGKEFLSGVIWWMCVAVPATFTNSMVGALCREALSEV